MKYDMTEILRTQDSEGLNLAIVEGLDVATINFLDFVNSTGFANFSKYFDEKFVKILLNNGMDVNVMDNEGKTALIHVIDDPNIRGGTNEVLGKVKFLVNNGAEVNIKTNNSETSLMIASKRHSNKIVDFLIKNGATVNAIDEEGETALLKSCKYASFHSGNGSTNSERIDTIKLLLDAKADVNTKDNLGNTAFMLSVKNNLSIPIKLFLNHGVDVSKENIDINALFLSSLFHNDNFELSNYLLDNSVKVNYRDENENTFLLLAIYDKCNLEVIQYLIDRGIDIDFRKKDNLDSISVLRIAINRKMIDVIELLVTNNVNSKEDREYLLENINKFSAEDSKKMYLLLSTAKIEKPIKEFEIWYNQDNILTKDNIEMCMFLIETLKLKIHENKEVKDESFSGFIHFKSPQELYLELKSDLFTSLDADKNTKFQNILKNYIDEIGTNKHNPKKLVELLTNFRKDTPIKYTTHDWDMKYSDFDEYMAKVTEQWYKIESELKALSPHIHKKIYTFLIEKNPNTKDANWCSKEGDSISIGWSSLDGLKKWCNEKKNPFDFILEEPLKVEGKTITTFGEVRNLFKQEIQIRNENNMLENIFLDIEEKYIDTLDIETIKLKGKSFYTDVEYFRNVLNRIFSEIGKRKAFKKIKVEVIEDDNEKYIDLRITHIGSEANRSKEEMLNISNGGDVASIKESLSSLCYWSIESSNEEENYRINYLKNPNEKDSEILDYNPEGFTHILRFYK